MKWSTFEPGIKFVFLAYRLQTSDVDPAPDSDFLGLWFKIRTVIFEILDPDSDPQNYWIVSFISNFKWLTKSKVKKKKIKIHMQVLWYIKMLDTVCPKSPDPFHKKNVLHKIGQPFLDTE